MHSLQPNLPYLLNCSYVIPQFGHLYSTSGSFKENSPNISDKKFSIENPLFISSLSLAQSLHKCISIFFPLIILVKCTVALFLWHLSQSILSTPIIVFYYS